MNEILVLHRTFRNNDLGAAAAVHTKYFFKKIDFSKLVFHQKQVQI